MNPTRRTSGARLRRLLPVVPSTLGRSTVGNRATWQPETTRALAETMRDEYPTILEAGLDLQLDCPDLAQSRHMLFTHLNNAEFLTVAATHVEALEHALHGLPRDRIRLHIC